jgi:hypothetical protein
MRAAVMTSSGPRALTPVHNGKSYGKVIIMMPDPATWPGTQTTEA